MRKILWTTVLGLALVGASQAHALGSQVGGVRVLSYRDGPVALTLFFDRPLASGEAKALSRDLEMGEATVGGLSHPAVAAAPDRTVIACDDEDHVFSDRKDTMSFRFNCRNDTMNWGFKIKPEL